MKISILSLLVAFLFIQAILTNRPLNAQPVDTYVRADSTQDYWRLRADQHHTTPVVQFFNRHHQLLYQEQLPESNRIVNRRMARTFDVLLASLTTNRILATAYLSPASMFRFPEPAVMPARTLSLRQVLYKKGMAVMDVQPSVNQDGQLIIHFAQDKRRLVTMQIDNDDRNVTYFDDCSNLTLYHRNLNLSQLPSGAYHLTLQGHSTTFGYRLTIDRALNRFYLQKETDIF